MSTSDNAGTITFGIITDIHFSTTSEPAAAAKTVADLHGWLEYCKQSNVDFLLQLGDLIKGSSEFHQEELRQVVSILKNFSGIIHHVIGNHCLALPKKEFPGTLGLPVPYYSFKEKGFRFIVLDGMDVSIHNIPATQEDRQALEFFLAQPEKHDYCGAVGLLQKAWLKQELGISERAGEKVIVVCHFPLLPETSDTRHGLLWNHQEIVELIVSCKSVKACLSGHYHYGGYALKDDIHFIVLPAFVNRHEHPRFACGTVELQSDRIVIYNQNDNVVYDLPFLP